MMGRSTVVVSKKTLQSVVVTKNFVAMHFAVILSNKKLCCQLLRDKKSS